MVKRLSLVDEVVNDDPLTDEEWAFAQLMQNPVLFREFINEGNPNKKPLEAHERAWSTSESAYVSMCCGRAVRKTETMIELTYYWMVNESFIPGDPGILIYVPNKAQKDAIWPRIRDACESHWLMSRLVDHNRINEQVGKIEFMNGFSLVLRIAGSDNRESNVISIHGPRVWVDEAQDFPWRAWLSLGNVLKREVPWHMLWVSGVPNGERQENVLFHCDEVDEKYSKYNIGQDQMTTWTPEMEYERRVDYNAVGHDSENYKHYVLGQHGVPTFSLFDRTRFLREDYEVFSMDILQHNLDTTKRPDNDGVVRYHIEEQIECPPLPIIHGVKPKVGLGYDVGFQEPSVFFVMYQDIMTETWRCLARYVLRRVEYILQRDVLVWLDKIYNFDFMGIDMGGVGAVQYQDLTSELAEEHYRERKFDERLYTVHFGASMTVAVKTQDDEIKEKKDNVKRVAVETLSRWVHEKKFSFSGKDTELMAELERTKYTRNQFGDPVYRTENDHQMAALMCAIMAYENKFGVPLLAPRLAHNAKLLPARWLMT